MIFVRYRQVEKSSCKQKIPSKETIRTRNCLAWEEKSFKGRKGEEDESQGDDSTLAEDQILVLEGASLERHRVRKCNGKLFAQQTL